MFRRFVFFALLTALFGAAVPVRAHGYIVRAIPADRVVLERAPTRVQYWFSEGLEPDFSSLRIYDQQGALIAEGGVNPDNINMMSARLPAGLSDGAYVVDLRPTFASDGHRVAETRVFFVGAEVGGVQGAAASDQAVPLEVVWRAVLYSSTTLLLGVFGLYGLVLVPAWGNPQHSAGLLPPRVMRRLNWIVWGSLAAAAAANVLALFQQSMSLFNADLITVLREGYWQIVRIGSRFGDVWNWRMAFLAVAAAVHFGGIYYRQQQPKVVRACWTANMWVIMLVIGASSAASHAAGSLIWPWAAVFVNWVHALAVAFWIGGLAALVLVLPAALRPYAADERRAALLAALNRFSRLAVCCVGIVIASGIYSALNWFYTPRDLASSYGGVQIAKVLMVVALLLVAAVQHVALHPARFARFAGVAQRVGGFASTLRLEVLIAVGVLSLAALLTATPPPLPEFLDDAVDAPVAEQTVGDLTVRASLTPGGTGINTYDLLITRGGVPADNLDVRLQLASPSRDWRGQIQRAEAADSGLYVAAGDEIDRVGEWWLLVDVVRADGDWQRAAFRWQINADAAVITSRPPGALNLLALAGVIGAILYGFSPALRRFYGTLNLTTTNVTIAVLAFVGTAIALIGGAVFLAETARQSELQRNPPPQIINPVLPDAESLARGEALFTAYCGAWLNEGAALNALLERLPRTRDEALFAATREGWRDLPPCAGELADAMRWDVVNYLRTLEV